MAAIYDPQNGATITAGLQGCNVCDAALQAAKRIADELGRDVQLEDDDGDWLVHPQRPDGAREAADPIDGVE